MRIFHCLAIRIGCGVCLLVSGLFVPVAVAADDLPLDEAGRLVRFHRDIAPIFRDHCLGCHGPEEEKAGFRIDDREFVLDYLVPEEPESSMLYTDYLASTDEDFLMPPKGHNDPLSPGELALVRVWIEEGADWPEDAKVTATKVTTVNGGAEVNAEAVGKEPVEATGPLEAPAAVTLPARVWAFQGYFHPAVIHFPIALLSVGGLFVIVGLKWPVMGTQVPLACLLLGSVSSVTASIMGWSFATQLGYMSLFNPDTEIFWHRWSGVAVSAVALIFAFVAVINLRRKSDALQKTWKVGLVVLAILIGMIGHQGGELHYGKDFYPKAFEKLFGKPLEADDTESVSEEELASTE